MATLNSTQRKALESAVIKARKIAEQGAEKALKNLAVDQPEPFSHMSMESCSLRRMLFNKALLLGNSNMNGNLDIGNLTTELAYEYWHKILFARFLEANNLLIHPVLKVSISLDDCKEFAAEEGFNDRWAAAAYYASHMLPAIFRPEDPLMKVEFATEDRIALEQLMEGIDGEIFTATDSLGWVYQYWQSEAKAAINASGDKIDGKKLPAVTQLFTEPYMVHFLIDNTIGAWWISRNPGKLPPVKFEYLRFLEDGTPAAGKFEGWLDTVREITALDPCMGSGHFVVELFLVFVVLRMYEEGLTREEASRKVIAENLYGLEIDPRCTQIAAFNLALTAWKFCGHYFELPEMNLACCGLAPKGKKEDWVKLVGKVERADDKVRLERGMEMLYDHFQLAPELGSLLDPTTIKPDAFTASFEQLQPVLAKALENETDKDLVERGVMAAGIAKAGQLLAKKYMLQITNVPYLARGKQDDVLANYCEKYYLDAKGNLATVFFVKMLKSAEKYGIVANVTLQDWLFKTTNIKLREELLNNENWSIVARLGAKGFQTTMYDFNVMLISIQHHKPSKKSFFPGTDVSEALNASAKDEALKMGELKLINQLEQLANPDAAIVLDSISSSKLLKSHAISVQGLATSDDPQFTTVFWELPSISNGWVQLRGTVENSILFGGCERLIHWENGTGRYFAHAMALKKDGKLGGWKSGTEARNKKGIIVSQMSKIPVSIYLGEFYDHNACVIIPHKEDELLAIMAYCFSPFFNEAIRKIDQSIKPSNNTIIKIPFDLEHWQKVAAEKYPNGLPKPYSDDPTQWLFHGHPQKTNKPLQVALARLLDYRWPAESDDKMELSDEAVELYVKIKYHDYLSDDDGIVCLEPCNNEEPAAERLREFIKTIWGDDWDNFTLANLLKMEGSNKTNLEQWLRDEFFEQHCKVFQNRPFIWHIWDGRKDGFAALVNYHLLNKDRLKKLIYTYLNDWIRTCEQKVRDNESGADGLLLAAKQLKEKLELILTGKPPYDIFVRWKPLDQQPIGWEPDLNDGVRLNIYPFIKAGVLRKNPNIKWDKDRGKNPEGSYWGPDRYNRYEELADEYKLKDDNKKLIPHLTNEVKLKARQNKQ